MQFKSSSGGLKRFKSTSGGANMLIAAGLVLVPGILIWVLLGEFNVLGFDYLHALGNSTGQCYAAQNTTTPVECADGTQVLLYSSSHVSWQAAVGSSLLVPWAIGVCAVLCLLKWSNPRIFPFAVATAALTMTITLSGAVPNAQSGLLIFARVVMVLVGAAIGFIVTNLLTNAIVLWSKRGAPLYEQIAKEIEDSKVSKEHRISERRKKNSKANDKDYVEDIKR